MKKLLIILLLLAVFIGQAWGVTCIRRGAECTGDIGTTTYDSDNNTKTDYKGYVTEHSITCTGTLVSISAVLANVDTVASEYILVLYDDDGGSGEPGTLLASTTKDLDSGTDEDTFLTLTKTISESVTNGDTVWIGFFTEDQGSRYRTLTGGTGRLVQLTEAEFLTPPDWGDIAATPTTSTLDRVGWVSYD